MAFSKNNAAVATPPAAEAPKEDVKVPLLQATGITVVTPAPRTAQGAEDKKVRGQVAMHAIIEGYDAASRLVLTLAPKPDEARNLLHTLAAEIAGKIETYSFHD